MRGRTSTLAMCLQFQVKRALQVDASHSSGILPQLPEAFVPIGNSAALFYGDDGGPRSPIMQALFKCLVEDSKQWMPILPAPCRSDDLKTAPRHEFVALASCSQTVDVPYVRWDGYMREYIVKVVEQSCYSSPVGFFILSQDDNALHI